MTPDTKNTNERIQAEKASAVDMAITAKDIGTDINNSYQLL